MQIASGDFSRRKAAYRMPKAYIVRQIRHKIGIEYTILFVPFVL